MAGRPKDPTINKKIYDEINRLLETTHFRTLQLIRSRKIQASLKQRFIVDGKIKLQLLWICLLNNLTKYL